MNTDEGHFLKVNLTKYRELSIDIIGGLLLVKCNSGFALLLYIMGELSDAFYIPWLPGTFP
jgi:hypothetical protein